MSREFSGFVTASGKNVTVSEESLRNIRRLWDWDVDPALDISTEEVLEISRALLADEESDESFVEVSNDGEEAHEKVREKVYLMEQSSFPEASPDELKAMEGKIEDMERIAKEAETDLKETRNQLKGLLRTLTTKEAQDQVSEITKEVDDLQIKYKKLSETTIVVDFKERQDIRTKREGYIKEWRVRKRKCVDMLETIMEKYPKSKRELYEDIGIETDEDYKVSIPTKSTTNCM